jgi:hypothetical protein
MKTGGMGRKRSPFVYSLRRAFRQGDEFFLFFGITFYPKRHLSRDARICRLAQRLFGKGDSDRNGIAP